MSKHIADQLENFRTDPVGRASYDYVMKMPCTTFPIFVYDQADKAFQAGVKWRDENPVSDEKDIRKDNYFDTELEEWRPKSEQTIPEHIKSNIHNPYKSIKNDNAQSI